MYMFIQIHIYIYIYICIIYIYICMRMYIYIYIVVIHRMLHTYKGSIEQRRLPQQRAHGNPLADRKNANKKTSLKTSCAELHKSHLK